MASSPDPVCLTCRVCPICGGQGVQLAHGRCINGCRGEDGIIPPMVDVEVVSRSVADELADALEVTANTLGMLGYMGSARDARKVLAAYRAGGNTNEETCARCGGVIVNPARHGEGWCIDVH